MGYASTGSQAMCPAEAEPDLGIPGQLPGHRVTLLYHSLPNYKNGVQVIKMHVCIYS